MQNDVVTQNKYMYSLYIGSLIVQYGLPYDTLYLHRDFTGIRKKLNAKKHSIELCLNKQGKKQRKHL